MGSYSVFYSPLKVGESKGNITILNEKLGEIWYEVKLLGLKSPPQKMPLFKAELGKFISQEISLFNPGDHLVETTAILSNTLNYEV